MADLKIGQVATLVGVGIDTVRYYEKLGLLPAAPRRASGYRVFDETTVERIKLIKQLQDMGLSLQEIDAMLRASGEHATCAHESEKIRAALVRTEERIAALTSVRTKLQNALARCTAGDCAIMRAGECSEEAARPARQQTRLKSPCVRLEVTDGGRHVRSIAPVVGPHDKSLVSHELHSMRGTFVHAHEVARQTSAAAASAMAAKAIRATS